MSLQSSRRAVLAGLASLAGLYLPQGVWAQPGSGKPIWK